MDSVKKICLFGPQGSGKGTQAEKIQELFNVPHFSPGAIFREELAADSEMGKKIRSFMDAGELVPSKITNEVMVSHLQSEEAQNGFILDGYPRNEVQAEAVDAATELTHVIVIEVPKEESIERMMLRGRDDDTPEAIEKRLNIYHAETEPLLVRYEQKGIVHRINGVGTVEEVADRIKQALS